MKLFELITKTGERIRAYGAGLYEAQRNATFDENIHITDFVSFKIIG